MAEKKDGITDLTKVLMTAAKKFNKKEYSKLQSVIFAMLHGVSYGYEQMDNQFMIDSGDLYTFYRTGEASEKEIKNFKKFKIKNNVVYLKNFKRETIKDES